MYRFAIEDLYKWKNNPFRKPLIISGARQVGKTWLMQEFGKQAYKQTVYINFDANSLMQNLFAADLSIERLLTGIELFAGHKLDAANTLLIFDEIQEVPRALSALKYFAEEAPEYHIICAGSLLGIALHGGTSFPVGKVDFLNLYPLSFKEFLLALNMEQYVQLLQANDFTLISNFKQTFIDYLKLYCFIGGMPEVVQAFSSSKDFNIVRHIQKRILTAYEQDFSKHAPKEIVPKIRMLWHSIPAQLAKDNKKFIYNLVKDGARAKDYETAIMWLSDCGLIYKIQRVNQCNLPLKAYVDLKAFKLFLLDVGLLSCMSNLQAKTLLASNTLFVEFKGALTEQFVCQQLKTLKDLAVYYYANNRNTLEIDFLLDNGVQSIPLEVKAELNLKAKSLKTFFEKFAPALSIRTSMADYSDEGWLVNLPLYAISEISNIQPKANELAVNSSNLEQIAHNCAQVVADDIAKKSDKNAWSD